MATSYETGECIFDGARSRVYRARRSSDGQPVIIKQLRALYPSSAQVRQFAREFVAANSTLASDWEGRESEFARGYTLPEGTFEQFLDFAQRNGTRVVDSRTGEDDAEAIARSEFADVQSTIETRIRAFVARRTFGIDAFFPVVGQIDPTLRQASRLWESASQLASL